MQIPHLSEPDKTVDKQKNDSLDDALRQRQSELTTLIDRLAGSDGIHATAIAPLTLYRLSAPTEPAQGIQKPTFCLVAQGSKQALFGKETHLHDPSRYLLVSVDLPITARIVEASPESPYLGLCIDIDPRQIGTLLLEMDFAENGIRSENNPGKSAAVLTAPGLSVSRTDPPLLDAVMRLLRLLDTPHDIPILAPLALREILYRLLTGEQGARLRQTALDNSPTQRVIRAIDWIKRNYAEPLRIEAIAQEACMSASSLHHHFKAVTAMSPLQYQKYIRLQEARRLMLYECLDAATAGYQVGYNSSSQFSREYNRLFGTPPLRDIARLRDVS